MRLVVIESPYAGDVDRNIAYARRAVRDCLDRGEAPFAAHLLYTQPGVLDDGDTAERARGILAGHEWLLVADACVVYCDHGVSHSMNQGIDVAQRHGIKIEYRKLLGAP